MQLDSIDFKILDLLQEDSKRTNKEIAHSINLSVTAVYERIKRLEREGIITKYVALINRKSVGKPFMVFCQIQLAQHSKEFLSAFERDVVLLNEVSECFHTTGDYDYILKIFVRDMEAYREFMVNKLTALNHIGNTRSIFIISDIKSTTGISF